MIDIDRGVVESRVYDAGIDYGLQDIIQTANHSTVGSETDCPLVTEYCDQMVNHTRIPVRRVLMEQGWGLD